MTQYTTQMDAARQGIITPQMEIVAEKEHFDVEELRELIAKGQVIIPCNKNHTFRSMPSPPLSNISKLPRKHACFRGDQIGYHGSVAGSGHAPTGAELTNGKGHR